MILAINTNFKVNGIVETSLEIAKRLKIIDL